MHGAILRRLSDDDPNVVSAVLSSKAVLSIAPTELAHEIKSLLMRSRTAYMASSGSKAQKKAHRTVIKQVAAQGEDLSVKVGLVCFQDRGEDRCICNPGLTNAFLTEWPGKSPLYYNKLPLQQVHSVAGCVRQNFFTSSTRFLEAFNLIIAVVQALRLLVGNEELKGLATASLLNFALATTSTKKLCAHIPQLASELQHPLLTGTPTTFFSIHDFIMT